MVTAEISKTPAALSFILITANYTKAEIDSMELEERIVTTNQVLTETIKVMLDDSTNVVTSKNTLQSTPALP